MKKAGLNPKLLGKSFTILGYKGSGKSYLAQKICSQFGGKSLYYNTLHEQIFDKRIDTYSPDSHNISELNSVIKYTIKSKRYKLLIIDEANRYAPPKPSRLPGELQDLNDWCRHIPMGVGYIARRPVQLNTDLLEISDYLFVFQLGGKNDIAYLNSLRNGLGDTIQNLQKYHFVFVKPDRNWVTCNPVSPPPVKTPKAIK